MEYTRETHYNKVILDRSKLKNWKIDGLKRSMLGIAVINLDKKIELEIDNKQCWILQGELNSLKDMNIEPKDLQVLTYVEGSYSPFGKKEGSSKSAIDGYELHIMY